MDNVRESLREEEAKKILDTINEDYDMSKIYEMIKDNKIEFEFAEKSYRVRLLNAKEKDELDTLRRKKFGQLLQDKDIMMEKDLINTYKERGINIEELDKEINQINKKIADVNFKLGASLANKAGESTLKMFKEEIDALTNELYKVMIKKNHLLDFSLENQLQNYVAKIISFLSLDIKIEEKWVRAYLKLDDYLQAEEKLVNLSAMYSMALTYRL
jgi:hypothetical protein